MPTFGPQAIGATGDNGFQDTGFWTPSFLNAGDVSGDNNPGWRWLNVTVPQGAIVSSATLSLRPRNLTGTITNVHMKIYGHKGDAPAFGEGTFEPTLNFAPTTAVIEWDPTSWVPDSAPFNLDVTSVVAELIADGSWASGSDLAIVMIDDGSVSGNKARMYAFDDGDTSANTLTIVYTVAGGNDAKVVIRKA